MHVCEYTLQQKAQQHVNARTHIDTQDDQSPPPPFPPLSPRFKMGTGADMISPIFLDS